MKSRESFLKNVPICTLTDLNTGFGGPWNKLQIMLVKGTFIMPQKKSFGQKKIWISCTGSKLPFWQNVKIAKMALKLCICNLFQGPPNPGFRSVKVQIDTFFKKDSRNLKNSFYLGFLWIPSKPGKQNWKVPFFWVFIFVKR